MGLTLSSLCRQCLWMRPLIWIIYQPYQHININPSLYIYIPISHHNSNNNLYPQTTPPMPRNTPLPSHSRPSCSRSATIPPPPTDDISSRQSAQCRRRASNPSSAPHTLSHGSSPSSLSLASRRDSSSQWWFRTCSRTYRRSPYEFRILS